MAKEGGKKNIERRYIGQEKKEKQRRENDVREPSRRKVRMTGTAIAATKLEEEVENYANVDMYTS